MADTSKNTAKNTPYLFTKRRPHFQDKAKDLYHNLPKYSINYVKSLFPIATWIGRYNLTWLSGDMIAGFTAGAVVIPQGMAYAKVVGLGPEYGLYSSFVGVSLYFLFATSKDITIGPTAVMSLLLGQSINTIHKTSQAFTTVELATSFALFSGIFSLILGMLRLGIIVDFIPGPVIAGFTTGSALTIAIGQIAKLLGIKDIDSKEPAYLVLGKTLGALGRTKIDAVIGICSLVYLYFIKYGVRYAAKRWPRFERVFFFLGILRNISVVVLATLISYLINIGKKESSFGILKKVPSGFSHIGPASASIDMLQEIAAHLPIIILILILEHVALAKSFGRINNYKINPSQELIAIGATNAVGSFFGAYPATGSFSRTAIKSKSGVRTPLAGIFSGILVILALYVLTPAFYFIPDANLCAVIIHAVLDLLSGPSYIKQLWRIEFWDFSVFVVGVVFTFFFTVDIGILASTGLALVVLLLRLARPRFDALGRLPLDSKNNVQRYAYVPIGHPSFKSVTNPPDGVLVFRFDESLTYPNASYVDDQIVDYARKNTKSFFVQEKKKGDRPWNELEMSNDSDESNKLPKPRLHAVVFDFAAVSVIDSTGIQALLDTRKELNKYAGQPVEFHFANILDEDIEESLIAGGFDSLDSNSNISINSATDSGDTITAIERIPDEEIGVKEKESNSKVQKTKRFFHLTIDEAIEAAAGY
ncbi:4961_t:CDS:2 [Funneliformis geosporum]|uniref:10395_t:CDS:1 n=1 Tax=Funneliformis geosporum TaxID=1117311 RepID=A0A9W4WST6_9GLOM|nr:10395_t:CDS:2 [Funneliformis geosporum]CAI2186653.1 4961_t:CDS:2 [Funneliformis geosporum]